MLNAQLTETEHSSQLKEYSQLLDNKTARIRVLERQLRELTDDESGSISVIVQEQSDEEWVRLDTGQNLLQVHLNQVSACVYPSPNVLCIGVFYVMYLCIICCS